MKATVLLIVISIPSALLVAQSAPEQNTFYSRSRVREEIPAQSTEVRGAVPATAIYPGASPENSLFGVVGLASGRAVSGEERALNQKIAKATKGLRTNDADKQAEAEKLLQDSLEQLFDVRTSSREKQIENLESRLKKLRDQLDARQQKKQEIVQLRLQTLLNEANGLSL